MDELEKAWDGYIQKLKNSSVSKSEWNKQFELLKGKASTILDVGAAVGDTVVKYAELFPNAKIHAFEPFPESFETLHTRFRRNSNIVLNKQALSDQFGGATMNVNKMVDTNSMLKSKNIGATSDKSCETVGQIYIDTDTLDNYCFRNKIQKIDILKIDVQGFEIEVLNGAHNLLQDNAIKMVFVESYFEQQYVDQPLFHEIAAVLYKWGFVLQDLYDPYFSSSNILWCDALFINKHYSY